jgi:two-component system OmpR family response regulator
MGDKVNILLVEDDVDMCAEMRSILEEESFNVDIVNDGQAAIEQIKIKDYKVALLDMKLPEMSGLDVLSLIKKEHSDTKVIVLTGSSIKQLFLSSSSDKPHNLKVIEKADFVLNKPFNITMVINKITELANS